MTKNALVPRNAAKLAREGRVDEIAEAASHALAKTEDVRELQKLESQLQKLKTIVGAVTGERSQVNKIAVPMVRTAVKGGRKLAELFPWGGDRKSSDHRDHLIGSVKEAGFSQGRATRWRVSGLVSDEAIAEREKYVLGTEDEIWSLAPVLKLGKEILRKRKREEYDVGFGDEQTFKTIEDAVAAGVKFNVIYADPPWSFKVWSGKGKERSAENYYKTETLEQLAAHPVEKLAECDCVLLMWCVWPELPGALEIINAWGFEYKTCGFLWEKTVSLKNEDPFTGMGYWTRANSEACLLATRGKPERMERTVHQVVRAPVGEHSAKPDEVADRIERLLLGPYGELFARKTRPGWTSIGDQL